MAAAQVLVGAAFTYNIDNTNYLWQNCYVIPSAVANGDSFGWYATLAAGTYKVVVWYDKFTDRGKQDIYIGSQLITTIDTYGASLVANQQSLTTGIIIPANDTYLVKSVVNGKNAASSSFGITNQRWLITQ